MLREITGLGLARAENLVDATQNADVFVEVSGLVKALASSLVKISGDLRLLSSGPEGGIGEIRLPARQAGSSIMPGKVNPVIPEAVTQAAILAIGRDQALTMAASMGSLELNPFLPLVAHCLLENFDLLARACDILGHHCVAGIEADEARCRRHVENATASATALLPLIGYDRAAELVEAARAGGRGLKETAIADGFVTAAQFDACTSAEAVSRLGFSLARGGPEKGRLMQAAPKALRLHIGLFGRRNVGKSSLLNAITRQQVSIVSAVAGTTTDPVEKPMELLPLGPGALRRHGGRRRRGRARRAAHGADQVRARSRRPRRGGDRSRRVGRLRRRPRRGTRAAQRPRRRRGEQDRRAAARRGRARGLLRKRHALRRALGA